VSPRGTS
jgi:hypothetical protein